MANSIVGQGGYTTSDSNEGGISASTLSSPQGDAATDGVHFFLADTANNRILGFNKLPVGVAGAATVLIGQDAFTTSSSGTSPETGGAIQLNHPNSVSLSDAGAALVVADSGNNRVLIWNSLPTSNTAPDIVLGQPNFMSSTANYPGGAPGAASLSNPRAAFISMGRLVVADSGNNRILIWNSVPTVDGAPANIVLGQQDFGHNNPGIDVFNGGTHTYTMAMRAPSDVWSNGASLLVVDSGNNRVLVWDSLPSVVNQVADHVIGQSSLGQGLGQAGAKNLDSPQAVASDGTNVYVADSKNNRVLEFSQYLKAPSTGTAADHVFGQIDFSCTAFNDPDQNGVSGASPTAGTLHTPLGVTVSKNGELYITDSDNNRVLGFASASGAAATQACNSFSG